jgi:hypothetical protein
MDPAAVHLETFLAPFGCPRLHVTNLVEMRATGGSHALLRAIDVLKV